MHIIPVFAGRIRNRSIVLQLHRIIRRSDSAIILSVPATVGDDVGDLEIHFGLVFGAVQGDHDASRFGSRAWSIASMEFTLNGVFLVGQF